MRRTLIAVALLGWTAAGAHAQPLPGVDTKGLVADEIGALSALMKEGACPCNPRLSLFECIEKKSCPQATELAAFGADRFRDGDGIEQVREAVVRKYLDEHVTFTFELGDTPSKGAKDGRIQIVEFADFECPHCALMRPVLEEVVKAYPKDVTVYFKQFPLQHHMFADLAARATLAAHRQGRFWPMHDLIFTNQGKLSAEKFVEFATELGLNVEKFKADLEDPALAKQIQRDRQEAIDAQLTGTPTLYINGKLYTEDKSPEAIKAYVQKAIGKLEAKK
ncbi:MAG: thioredoxin domain-containing protein [Myxococcales bacterium]|nr:thioredoxin domain-containing protein [Myxococcales bacterium]